MYTDLIRRVDYKKLERNLLNNDTPYIQIFDRSELRISSEIVHMLGEALEEDVGLIANLLLSITDATIRSSQDPRPQFRFYYKMNRLAQLRSDQSCEWTANHGGTLRPISTGKILGQTEKED